MAQLTMAQYAETRKKRGLTGGSKVAVWKAVKAGRIRLDPDGLIDPEEADLAWAANTNPAKARRPDEATPLKYRRDPEPPADGEAPAKPKPHILGHGWGKTVKAPAPKAEVVVPATTPQAPSNSFGQLREERERMAIQEQRIDLEEKMGRLIPVEHVRSEWFRVGQLIQQRVLGIPARISAELATLTDQHAITTLLDQELRTALEELAGERPPGVPT